MNALPWSAVTTTIESSKAPVLEPVEHVAEEAVGGLELEDVPLVAERDPGPRSSPGRRSRRPVGGAAR